MRSLKEKQKLKKILKQLEGNMKEVPKCEGCEYHKLLSALSESRGSINVSRLVDNHCCTINKGSYPVINSNELRTSPKWCPKRNEV